MLFFFFKKISIVKLTCSPSLQHSCFFFLFLLTHFKILINIFIAFLHTANSSEVSNVYQNLEASFSFFDKNKTYTAFNYFLFVEIPILSAFSRLNRMLFYPIINFWHVFFAFFQVIFLLFILLRKLNYYFSTYSLIT